MDNRTYNIIRYSGTFAKSLLPNNVLSRFVVSEYLSEYFYQDTIYTMHDKWGAVKKFAEYYHDIEFDPYAFDFQDGVDCISVVFYQLVEMSGNFLTDIIFESDFPTMAIE